MVVDRVWVADPSEAFREGVIIRPADASGRLTVQVDPASFKGGGHSDVPPLLLPKHAVFRDTDRDYDDCCQLPRLTNFHILRNVERRYKRGVTTTLLSDTLISIVPLSSNDDGRSLEAAKAAVDTELHSSPPSAYTFTEHVLHRLKDGSDKPSFIVTGDAGAGKTHMARTTLQYICWRLPSILWGQGEGDWTSAEPLHPILEAFGNATTRRNGNSSRYGRLTTVQALAPDCLSVQIEGYLLEKSRVLNPPVHELSFHILHLLSRDALFVLGQPRLRAESEAAVTQLAALQTLYVTKDNYYNVPQHPSHILSKADSLPGCLSDVIDALFACGFLGDEIIGILGVLTAINLLLGLANYYASTIVTRRIDPTHEDLKGVACFLGVSSQDLFSLTSSVHLPDGETILRDLSDIIVNLRTLTTDLYSMMFTHLLKRVSRPKLTGDAKSVQILDLFGFEIVQHNDLAQLCINAANEKLHNDFLKQKVQTEISMLREEGLLKYDIDLPDNAALLDMLYGSMPWTIFSIINDITCVRLDPSCSMGVDPGAIILSKIGHNARNGKYKDLIKSGSVGSGDERRVFTVRHLGGNLMYEIDHWHEKNRLKTLRGFGSLFLSSKNSLLKQAAEELGAAGAAEPHKFDTILKDFTRQLDSLDRAIRGRSYFFIKCIRPDVPTCPGVFDRGHVLTQMDRLGMPVVAEIVKQSSFPMRTDFHTFNQSLKNDCPLAKETADLPPAERTALLLTCAGVDSRDYRLGKSQIWTTERIAEKVFALSSIEDRMVAVKMIKRAKVTRNLRRLRCIISAILFATRLANGRKKKRIDRHRRQCEFIWHAYVFRKAVSAAAKRKRVARRIQTRKDATRSRIALDHLLSAKKATCGAADVNSKSEAATEDEETSSKGLAIEKGDLPLQAGPDRAAFAPNADPAIEQPTDRARSQDGDLETETMTEASPQASTETVPDASSSSAQDGVDSSFRFFALQFPPSEKGFALFCHRGLDLLVCWVPLTDKPVPRLQADGKTVEIDVVGLKKRSWLKMKYQYVDAMDPHESAGKPLQVECCCWADERVTIIDTDRCCFQISSKLPEKLRQVFLGRLDPTLNHRRLHKMLRFAASENSDLLVILSGEDGRAETFLTLLSKTGDFYALTQDFAVESDAAGEAQLRKCDCLWISRWQLLIILVVGELAFFNLVVSEEGVGPQLLRPLTEDNLRELLQLKIHHTVDMVNLSDAQDVEPDIAFLEKDGRLVLTTLSGEGSGHMTLPRFKAWSTDCVTKRSLLQNIAWCSMAVHSSENGSKHELCLVSEDGLLLSLMPNEHDQRMRGEYVVVEGTETRLQVECHGILSNALSHVAILWSDAGGQLIMYDILTRQIITVKTVPDPSTFS